MTCGSAEVTEQVNEIFGNEFREELTYFDDIDHTEQVNYMEGFEVSDEVIKQKLGEISLQKS